MSKEKRLWLLAAIAALILTASACADTNGSVGDADDMSGTNESESGAETSGMDHSEMSGMGGMDMGSMLMDEEGEYSDELFIDEMVPHHLAVIEEAEIALENSERPELIELSGEIITSQEREIEELRQIKQREFGSSEVPSGMSDEDMQMMGMPMSPEELANARPFDRAFIDNMIPHHESAIEMSEVALENSENEDIRRIAQEIIDAQRSEIEQMQQWREERYPND